MNQLIGLYTIANGLKRSLISERGVIMQLLKVVHN